MDGVRPCLERPTGVIPWLFRADAPASGRENMAADEALLESQKDPAALPVLRLFRWSAPTLSYGRLQNGHAAANQAMVLGAGSAVRRPTGGGTVLHKDDLSFSLAWRRDHPAFPACLKNIYRSIHETVQYALRGLGVACALHERGGPPSVPGMCFEAPAADDLMREGKKILGGAIRVTGWGRLYQGNLVALEVGTKALSEALRASFRENFFGGPEKSGGRGGI